MDQQVLQCLLIIVQGKYSLPELSGHWLAIGLDIEHIFFILVNVYGHNKSILNQIY